MKNANDTLPKLERDKQGGTHSLSRVSTTRTDVKMVLIQIWA